MLLYLLVRSLCPLPARQGFVQTETFDDERTTYKARQRQLRAEMVLEKKRAEDAMKDKSTAPDNGGCFEKGGGGG